MRRALARLSLVFSALLWGCGGGGSAPTTLPPAAPATPTPVPAPAFFDGATGAGTAAQITPAAPRIGEAVTVTAAGFLTRQQLFSGAPIHLWPAIEEYVSEFVYGWRFTDGSYRMVRWQGPFVVTLDGELAESDAIVAKAREVIDEVRRVTGLALTLGPGGACVISLDSNIGAGNNAVGLVRLRFQGATIAGAQVVFANRAEITGGPRSDYRNTLLHEIGHVLGLRHSPSDRDVMTPGSGPGTKVAEFQDEEATALRMMYLYRSAGNFPPDRDPAVGARSAAQPLETVIRD